MLSLSVVLSLLFYLSQSLFLELTLTAINTFFFFLAVCIYGGACFHAASTMSGASVKGTGFACQWTVQQCSAAQAHAHADAAAPRVLARVGPARSAGSSLTLVSALFVLSMYCYSVLIVSFFFLIGCTVLIYMVRGDSSTHLGSTGTGAYASEHDAATTDYNPPASYQYNAETSAAAYAGSYNGDVMPAAAGDSNL